jgi:hypothetical protein
VLYAAKLDRSAKAWQPTASDAFTVGGRDGADDERVLRPVEGLAFRARAKAKGDSFNVVSRLSDIGDILGGLRVIYAGIGPAIARPTRSTARRPSVSSTALWQFVAKLKGQERAGKRFTPNQADTLGRAAQERATAIAGQVTQAAARLKVKIAQ